MFRQLIFKNVVYRLAAAEFNVYILFYTRHIYRISVQRVNLRTGLNKSNRNCSADSGCRSGNDAFLSAKSEKIFHYNSHFEIIEYVY